MLSFRGAAVSVSERPVHPSAVFPCACGSSFLHSQLAPGRSVPWAHAKTWHTVFTFCVFVIASHDLPHEVSRITPDRDWRLACGGESDTIRSPSPFARGHFYVHNLWRSRWLIQAIQINLDGLGNVSAHRQGDGCNERENSYPAWHAQHFLRVF